MQFPMKLSISAALAAAALAAAPAFAGKTLDTIKSRGQLVCGVNTGLAGFSAADSQGKWTGLDVDLCKAIAAAMFGDAEKSKFTPTTAQQRFVALQSGEVDVITRNATQTLLRDTSLGFNIAGVNFYDGQGFLVPAKSNIKSAKELNGATICVQPGTTTELNLADYFKANNMTYKPVVFEKLDETVQAYLAGRCDVYTTDQSGLYSIRVQQPKPDDHVVLPEIISKEPLGPAVRQGDSQWLTIVKWVHNALLNAEELGVSKANIDQMLNSPNPDIKRLVGKEGDFGKGIGLDNDWAVKITKSVGNYGELFERNLGLKSPLKLERRLYGLASQGGMHYSPAFR